jgi:hypothetical protein
VQVHSKFSHKNFRIIGWSEDGNQSSKGASGSDLQNASGFREARFEFRPLRHTNLFSIEFKAQFLKQAVLNYATGTPKIIFSLFLGSVSIYTEAVEPMTKYFKGVLKFHGLRAPEVRTVVATFKSEILDLKSLDQSFVLAEELLSSEYSEDKVRLN